MAPPPAKRRKRGIVDDSDDDVDVQLQSKNTLERFLFSSPEKKRNETGNGNSAAAAAVPDSPSPIRKRTTRAVAAAKSPAKTTRSPGTSPIKSRTRAQTKRKTAEENDKEKGKSGDLLKLFSKQALRSQSSLSSQSASGSGSFNSNGYGTSHGSSTSMRDGHGRLDDIISDPISEGGGGGGYVDDDDDVPLYLSSAAAASSSLVGKAKAAHKRFAGSGAGAGSGTGSLSGSTNTNGGGKFLRPPVSRPKGAATAMATSDSDSDARPWSERFAPVNLDELAVHKRKVLDVRRWLEEVLAGRMRQRLLVLKGPAGTGKTTTVRLLAKDMRCEVLEWRNPANSFGMVGPAYPSAAAQFEEFLGRGGKFGQLDVEEEGTTPPPPPPASASDANGMNGGSERRLILIEEFPNTFMRSSTGLVAFRNAILQFLAANTPALMGFGSNYNSEPITPIVMVISETLLTTTSASADSFTAHRLLGPEILRHPGTGVIEFNPVAPTFLSKALELVVQKEARKSGRRRTPGPLVLQRLGEIGDIRNAIASLEFLCVKGDDEADWGSKIAFTKPKRGSKDVPALTRGEQDSLELVSQREATLGIFHAVGKVVYNKRGDFPPGSVEAAAELLPGYMAHLSRPKRSDVAVDTLMDEIGTDTHTFISSLHENYALSCEQSSPLDPNSSLDYINNCLDYLSESDLLCPSWDVFFGGKGFGGGYSGKDSGSHIVRQDEMAFQVAVRGLLFSLPSPVKRQTHPTGRGGDSYKMFYPTYLKLWRTKEELEGLADMWATKMLKGEDGGPGPPDAQAQSQGPLAFTNHGPGAFRKPGSNGFLGSQVLSSVRPVAKSEAQPHRCSAPLLSLGNAARQELLLERLPYMAHIARRRRCSFGTMRIKDLERIVSFQGIGPLGAGEDEGDDGQDEDSGSGLGMTESWATDRPTEEGTPRKKKGLGAILSGRAGRLKKEGEEMPSLPMQSLVISDDDIEDD
ncbi:Cell cycle checkpoint protein RAD17 [Madurella mycetomatis]|uniref:Cell cycle checkpoint protein RAD17 n=1 Tax=Madurella mycetomatis TaxID=100816 RepID=A0A175VVR5_9PEZI|nr:Cell cycle checkpoint protein RAD17 [Madurella mycetomatis]